jgi:hypothetical protein
MLQLENPTRPYMYLVVTCPFCARKWEKLVASKDEVEQLHKGCFSALCNDCFELRLEAEAELNDTTIDLDKAI